MERQLRMAAAGAAVVGAGAAVALAAAVPGSGSATLLAAALHRAAVAAILAALLAGLGRASEARERTDGRPGREAYFSGFVLAVLLLGLAGGASLQAGVSALAAGGETAGPPGRPVWIALALAAGLAADVLVWLSARSRDAASGDGVDRADGLVSPDDPRGAGDSAAALSARAVAATGGLGTAAAALALAVAHRTGLAWVDAAGALLVGAVLAGAAVLLALETRRVLVGRAVDTDLIEDVIGMAGQAPFVDGVNEARCMHFGPMDVLVNLSVDARDVWTAGAVERESEALEARIRQRHPQVSRVFIEIQSGRGRTAAPPPDAAPA